jgi:chitodextrinase
VSAATAAKRTLFAPLTLVALVAVSLVGASAAAPGERDRQEPSAPQNLRVSAATQDSVTLSWDVSNDNVAVTGYYVYVQRDRHVVDKELETPAFTVRGLRCGESVQVGVVAFDDARNRSERATAIVSAAACLDTQAPTPPSKFVQAATSESAVVLTWTPSTDDVGVVAYGVYRHLQRVASPSEPSVALAGLPCGRSFEHSVDAVDAAGNRSSLVRVWVTTKPCARIPSPGSTDTQAPSTPSGLAASNIAQTSLTLTWNPSTDNVGVVGYDVFRNDVKVASPTATNANLTGLTCATPYTLEVQARDAAGNASERARLGVTTAACSSPPPPPSDTQAPSTPSGLRVASSTTTSVSLAWNPSTDNVGVAGYRAYRNGTLVATGTQTASTVGSLTCGNAYTFEVSAFDGAGNASPRASVVGSTQACPDTEAPSAPANVTATSRTTTSIALTWSASFDDNGVAGYGLYKSGTLVGTSLATSWIYSGLACGTNYTLAVDAYDAAGNRSAKTTVMVATTACSDTSPPSTPTGLKAANVTQTGLTLTWDPSSDNVGVTGYDVYRNGTKTATVSATSAAQLGLACGTSYAFGVVARDAAGNSSPSASLQVSTSACSQPPPGNRYTDIDFATGRYEGEGVATVFAAYQSDPRLSDWGGLPSDLYDSRGMTLDQAARVHLTAGLGGRAYASWQELRTTDGPWANGLNNLAKSSLNVTQTATWGPGGFAWGIERWFAFDYYVPLNVNGVSFEFSNTWNVLGDLHSNGGHADPGLLDVVPSGNSHPKYLEFATTPNTQSVPYLSANLLQLTNSNGSRATSSYNTWHEIVIGMRTGHDNTAWIEVWHDGVLKLARTNRALFDPSEAGPYFQLQNYTGYPTSYVGGATRSAIAYGGFRAGLTRGDVQTR